MYKIVLADDEPIITRGLRKMIGWEHLNAEVTGVVNDGKQLMDLIRKEKPDIVISDIAMPNLSGLDVIKAIQENHWNIKVIFLSGYQEFNYAKQAITYGAVDYLLKPAAKNELEQAILNAENQLRKENPVKLWNGENDLAGLLQEFPMNRRSTDLKENLRIMQREAAEKSFACVFFSLSDRSRQAYPDRNKLAIVQFSVFQSIQDYLKKNRAGLVLKRMESRYDTVFFLPPKGPSSFVEKILSKLRSGIEKDFRVELLAGVGDAVDRVPDLKYAYKTAKFAFELHYFHTDPIIFYKDISKEFHRSFEDYGTAYKEFFQSVINRGNEWPAKLEACLDIIENLHYGNRYAAEDRCITMAIVFYRDLKEYKLVGSDHEKQAEYEDRVSRLRNQPTYRELKDRLTGLFENLISTVCRNKSAESPVIYEVKEYIGKHFSEEITLEQIAKLVYMNPYYFSTYFKRKTGKNFKAYLTEIRMKKALIILRQENIKTAELARAVGYRDVRTFTDKFRETYGDSPAALKKKKN